LRSKVFRVIVAVVVVLLAAIAVFVTQPILVRGPDIPRFDANPESLRAHVVKLARELVPRDLSHPANLDAAAAYVRRMWQEIGIRTEEQSIKPRDVPSAT